MYKKTDKNVIKIEIDKFLTERGYHTSERCDINGKKIEYHLNSTVADKTLLLTIKKGFGYIDALLEDVGEPFLLKKDSKYEFKFRKKYPEEEKPLLSYDEVENSESFIQRLIYGTGIKELRKLYNIMPELKQRTLFRLYDHIAESMLGVTAVANIIESLSDDAYWILLGGVSSVAELYAENISASRATKITSTLPQARYAKLQDSPRNTINKIVERMDVNSWIRLLDTTKEICIEKNVLPNNFSPSRRISKLESILISSKDPSQDISDWLIKDDWPIRDDERFKQALADVKRIDYNNIKENLSDYVLFLESKGLTKKITDRDKVLEKIATGYAGKSPAELRIELSDKIRKIIKEPTKEEYLEVIKGVRKELEKNIWSDTGVFFSKLVMSYAATEKIASSITLLGTYIATDLFKVVNSVWFERLNNVLRLNYMINELNKDPTVAGGADLENMFDAQIGKIEAATNALTSIAAVGVQYYARKDNNRWLNYVMYGVASAFMFHGMKKWYNYVNQITSRFEKEIKAKSDAINI